MPDYYATQRTRGEAFEAFIAEQLRALGHRVERHEGKVAQLAFGDLRVDGQDLEVKLDEKLAHTGNLYIEVAEKRDAARPDWTPSGIFSTSRARWYGIGDYGQWFVFLRSDLREVAPLMLITTIDRGTSQGFLLGASGRRVLCARELSWEMFPHDPHERRGDSRLTEPHQGSR